MTKYSGPDDPKIKATAERLARMRCNFKDAGDVKLGNNGPAVQFIRAFNEIMTKRFFSLADGPAR